MFLHKENQLLLWQTLQKSPYLVEFTQKFSGYREEWFRGTIEQFYTQWISRNNRVPNNAKELLEINKYALQAMVADLKRLLGYNASQQFGTPILAQPNAIIQSVNAHETLPTYQTRVAAQSELPTYQTRVAAQSELPTYDVNAERKQREDEWSSNFNKYQTEYNQLLKQPAVPTRGLPSETGGEKIKNMDELIREHAKMRDMDLSIYSPPPPQNSPTLDKPVLKLRILDEIERIEIDETPDGLCVARRPVGFLSVGKRNAEVPTEEERRSLHVEETDPIAKKSVRFEPVQTDEISSISQ